MSPPPEDRAATSAEHSPRFQWANFEGFLSGLNSIGTLWIVVLMVVINVDVIGRTAFTSPLPGVPELVSLSIVGIIFIQLGHTLRAGRITRADGLEPLRRRWPRIGFAFQGFFAVAGAILFAILFYASYPLFVHSWTRSEFIGVEGYITFPTWPVRLIILIGCACAFVQFLIFAWRDLMVVAGKQPLAGDEPAAPNIMT